MRVELLRGLLPAMPAPSGREMMRAAAGGAAGLALAAAVMLLAGLDPVLLAPMGATAVLAFAVPNSPLAQPWSAIAGCLVSALAAVPAAMFLPAPWSAAVAAGLAIAVMIAVRALHPPGGAAALLTALAADPAQPFALIAPLMLGTTILVAGAVIWNRLTGRVYPLRQTAAAGIATPQISLSRAELDGLLVRFRQGANLGAADLGRLLAAAEAEAAHHRFDGTTCGDIMTRPLISVGPDAHMTEIADLFARHAIKSVPVVNAAGGLAGIIQQGDLVRALMSAPTLRRRLTAARIMRTGGPQVQADLPVGALLEWLAVQGPQVVPVMEGARVAGVITRSDVINLLLREARARAGL
ncbi:HPP family protein [Paracoccus luteus]|uniref:HPP family protein n=1 Tax=Paracoccus luteus TaxID=2508543 RepID=UPI0010704047|nr:HPP family protein [Paracoccus luteus]